LIQFKKNFAFLKFFVHNHLINYPTPVNLNYFWSFGFCAGIFLVFQIATGIFLSMHYVSNVEFAFESVEHIMRDVNYGWFIRYLHSNGASFFFLCLYVHMLKNIFYRSYKYPRFYVWSSGVLIFIVSMATAFIGYVLPWGQMSFWGATVITNLFTAFPYFGSDLVFWIWGGFSVNNATLNRFFSIHYLLPFFILVLIIFHLSLLHEVGSNNPLCLDSSCDKISFYPYFFIKDIFFILLILFLFFIFVFFYPNFLSHSDNYLKANSLVTPIHIIPEWYFLPFYAVLRSIPNKFAGVLCMFFSIFFLFFLPFFDRSKYIISPKFNPFYELLFWFFFSNLVILGLLGAMPVEEPYLLFSRICTLFFFIFFILLFFYSLYENYIIKNFFIKKCL